MAGKRDERKHLIVTDATTATDFKQASEDQSASQRL
jgi:hypothetical protein